MNYKHVTIHVPGHSTFGISLDEDEEKAKAYARALGCALINYSGCDFVVGLPHIHPLDRVPSSDVEKMRGFLIRASELLDEHVDTIEVSGLRAEIGMVLERLPAPKRKVSP